jgi:hypothetical protein
MEVGLKVSFCPVGAADGANVRLVGVFVGDFVGFCEGLSVGESVIRVGDEVGLHV